MRVEQDRLRLTANEEAARPPRAPGVVPALENAIAIIEYLNRRDPYSASLSELCSALGISKGHCHAILKTLTYYGWLSFDARTKLYRPFSGSLASSSSVWREPALELIREHVCRIARETGVNCTVSQPQSDHSFILMFCASAPPLEVWLPIGHRYPRDAAAHMRAYLAWKSPEEIDAWMGSWTPVHYSATTIVDKALVLKELEATRARGYARSVEEFTEGVMGLALPIFDREGEVAFVLNCGTLVTALRPIETRLVEEMKAAVREIHKATQARPPSGFPVSLSPSPR